VITVSMSLDGAGGVIADVGSSINPPPGKGTEVNPGMTGGALHAAGPNAN
jgi:hypothetical protein